MAIEISKRQAKIIELLISADQPLTAQTLSQACRVSEKTIRNDVQQLNQLYGQPVIESKAGAGFFLGSAYQQLSTKKVVNQPNLEYDLLTHIIDHEMVDYYETAEQFYISESTLDLMIKRLNRIIATDDEAVIKRKQNKLYVDGSEDVRRMLFTRFLAQEIKSNRVDLIKYEEYFDFFEFQKLLKLVVHFLQSHEMVMNDFATISFVLHVAVIMDRLMKGSISHSKDFLTISRLSPAALSLIDEIEKEFDLKIPNEEYPYFHYLVSEDTKDQLLNFKEMKEIVYSLLSKINEQFYIDFFKDEKILDNLSNHLVALHARSRDKQYFSNTLTEEIKRTYPFIYNVSVYAASYIQKKLEITFPDYEITYIALHFLAASENISNKLEKNVLIISPFGERGNQIVINQLRKLNDFNFKIDVINALISPCFSEDAYDLILSTKPISTIHTPVIQYQLTLSPEDLRKITDVLQTTLNTLVLKDYVRPALFFADQTFKTATECILFMCQQLALEGCVDEDYYDLVLAREALSSTSFGNYAIPHAIERTAKENSIAICLFDRPIQWGENKVRMALLLAFKEERTNDFGQLFEELVQLLADDAFVKKLSKSKTLSEFLQLCQTQLDSQQKS